MKIVLMFTAFSLDGGSKSMVWVANQLSKAGHEVMLLSYFGKTCEQPLEDGVRFYCLNCESSKSRFVRNTVGMVQTISKLDRFLAKAKPDLVINFLDSVAQVYLLINRLHNRFPVISSERVDPFSYSDNTAKRLAFFMGLSDGVVFQTEQARSFYKNKPAIYDRSTVIPNPVVRTPEMEKLLQSGNAVRDNRIVTAGRLVIRQKRQDVLIRSFVEVHEKHPEISLHIFGDGVDRQRLQDMVRELGLEDCVVFEGKSMHILEDIHQARVFILSSDYEGIPNALIEAMMLGVPSVSTDCSPGGARLLIDDGENGFLVPVGDEKFLADRIIRLVEDDHIASHFSKKSVKIGDRFSEKSIAAMWCDFINNFG